MVWGAENANKNYFRRISIKLTLIPTILLLVREIRFDMAGGFVSDDEQNVRREVGDSWNFFRLEGIARILEAFSRHPRTASPNSALIISRVPFWNDRQQT